ncbi:hypothetical protein UY3_08084 [Chelonia mydas]|uniref:Uncharacterized protein n=1 Tax=Chelonia mydas TaxID=8469 RepID=M7BC50_CHEMY|nr:hypothetical protein UY3_08084 [Chelonia mydas]
MAWQPPLGLPAPLKVPAVRGPVQVAIAADCSDAHRKGRGGANDLRRRENEWLLAEREQYRYPRDRDCLWESSGESHLNSSRCQSLGGAGEQRALSGASSRRPAAGAAISFWAAGKCELPELNRDHLRERCWDGVLKQHTIAGLPLNSTQGMGAGGFSPYGKGLAADSSMRSFAASKGARRRQLLCYALKPIICTELT